ncbi:MAG: hypothetical protein GY713_17065 [Actinomycetia bacterium]|nr:hypothetical protein [Actinomycetes bacterium]
MSGQARPIAPNPPERVNSDNYDLLADWDELQLEVYWTDPDPQRSYCGSILAYDPTSNQWVDRWQFRTDEADQQQTWAPEGETDCADELAAGPGPDLIILLEEMRAEPNLLLCWFPHTDHGCETLLPHELVIGDANLVWEEGFLFLELTRIEVFGYQVNPLPEIDEDDLFNPPFDLLVLYENGHVEGKTNLQPTPEGLWGIGLGPAPPGSDLTFRVDFETPDGHLIASSGDFTLQVPPQ